MLALVLETMTWGSPSRRTAGSPILRAARDWVTFQLMLTRVFADNYRCFSNFTFEPKNFGLLVGDNGSGKSCLFEVLASLRSLATSSTALESSFSPATRTRWDKRKAQRFELACKNEDGRRFDWAVTIDEVGGNSVVASERIARDGLVFAERSGKSLIVNGSTLPLPYELRGSLLALDLDDGELRWLRTFISEIVLLKLEPSRMTALSQKAASALSSDGSNFAAGYRGLRERDFEKTQRLHAELRTVIPGFQSIEQVDHVDDAKILVFKVSADSGKTSYMVQFDELSDGQKVLVVLYHVITGFGLDRRTIFLDEPDNFVTLRELQPWLQELSRTVEDHGAQVLIVSHNSEVIDYLAAQDAWLFERTDGGPVRHRPLMLDPASGLKASEQIARGWFRGP
jgi:predicted ATPase